MTSADLNTWRWRDIPLWKRGVLVLLFFAAFMALDGSSTTAQKWEGAPPWYLPVGLSLALMLCAGPWSIALVLGCSVVAAFINYHCRLLSWSGIPGAVGVYLGYVATAIVLKRWWKADLLQGTVTDVVRYLVASFGGSIVSLIVGVSTVLADGKITHSQILKTSAEWWISDTLALVAFAPFVIIHVTPAVGKWLTGSRTTYTSPAAGKSRSSGGALELAAQAALAVLVIWLVFGCASLIPYQPLYLLFIPVIWITVRRGLTGAVLMTFTVSVGMTVAAWITQAPAGSLPRLQLATVALAMTGLCLGAVVTERWRGEESVRESERRYRLLFERNLAAVFRTTLDGRILECNPAAAQLFGYDSPEHLLAMSVASLYDNLADREGFMARLNSEKYIKNLEMKFRHKNGDIVWAMLNVSLVSTDGGSEPVLEGTLVNITDRKNAQEQVEALAYYDSLTGLPNRTLMIDRFSQALGSARRRKSKAALLFVDLDHFKTINDSLGHSAGDLLLREVASRIKACVREQDTVARLGGDEFLILLSDLTDASDIVIVAERCIGAMTTKFDIMGNSLSIGCSIGISIYPDHGSDTETLIKHADSAMYTAKDRGRNNFIFFSADMNRVAMERLQLENALRHAVQNSELFLAYQPEMDLVSARVVGIEALLRWRNPELGLVPPDRFIRIAETSGMIFPIGEWVLKTACRQAKQWHDQGLRVPIAVNVSAVQFRHEAFCDTVSKALLESGLPAEYLELELTETLLLAKADLTLSVLQRLKTMGVSLAIDDFGTGYSSLSYLQRFPVSKLKIDRSFIQDLNVNREDEVITTAIISLAKSLNLTVIAEGVETEQQLAFLRARQCSGVQGYYFSKPISAAELTEKYVRLLPTGDRVSAVAAW